MKSKSRLFIPRASSAVFAVTLVVAMGGTTAAKAEHASFKEEIFPIIQAHCLPCHQAGGEGHEKSGLDLTTHEGLMKGTRHGPIVIPGDAFSSNLNVLLEGRADPKIKMPHDGKELTKWERMLFRRWVNRGAKNN